MTSAPGETSESDARVSHLYQMAMDVHRSATAWTLRHAALVGICAEVAKQPGVVDWLRARGCLASEPFHFHARDNQWWIVMILDERVAPGAARGTPAPTVEDSAAAAVVWHLAECGVHDHGA